MIKLIYKVYKCNNNSDLESDIHNILNRLYIKTYKNNLTEIQAEIKCIWLII